MKKENILVSACLLGIPCRYDGKNNFIETLQTLKEKYNFIPVCPEVLGGLSTPRVPAERRGSSVITQEGKDVTEAFSKGATQTLDLAQKYSVKLAILKSKSPSCGFGEIYDGSFSRTLIQGNGLTAELLLQHGIIILNENNIKIGF